MKRLWGVCALSAAGFFAMAGRMDAAEKPAKSDGPLPEVGIDAGGGSVLSVPPSYGRLVDVAVSEGVHYLYFEDSTGAIRIVSVGPRGAAQRTRLGFQLLTPEVYQIKREERKTP